MQTYRQPFRKLESLNARTGTSTGAIDRAKLPSNSSEIRHHPARSLTTSRILNESTMTLKSNRNDQHVFMTVREYADRKRPSTETVVEEPARKKIQANTEVATIGVKKMEPVKGTVQSDNTKTVQQSQRCVTGDVGQILNFVKKFPTLDAFVEVYGKIFKMSSPNDRQKIILLKNSSLTGPVLQAIYNEIDRKMIEVKAGDSVRCIGKLVNNSYLKLFKVSLLSEEICNKLASRLFSLGNFVLTKKEKAKRSTAPAPR